MDSAPSTPPAERWPPHREAFAVWALVLVALAVFKFALSPLFGPFGGSLTGALAVALFLWAPTEAARRAGRPEDDYGLDLRRWKSDLLFALAVMLVVFPLFVLGFRLFLELLDAGVLPSWTRGFTPYGTAARFHWRAPGGLVDKVAGNIAVAIGEEFFYRGYVLTQLSRRWPARTRLLGAPFGKAMWLQTLLFALGHLLTPASFRLATFFPGLLFGWMAARSRRVVAPAIVHAASNLLIATLEASAFG